jgi:hypothetical protein
MLRTIALCLALALCPSPRSADEPRPGTRPIDEAETVMAVWVESAGGGLQNADRFPALVFAAWHDGHVVWSEDSWNGGPPYRAADIDPKRFLELLASFERDGLLDADTLPRSMYFGPDSLSTVVLIKSGARERRLQSWHEPYEVSGSIVAWPGLMGLDDRTRLEALREAPAEYLFFRFVWSETRQKLGGFVPHDGRSLEGHATMRGGHVTWHEGTAREDATPTPR